MIETTMGEVIDPMMATAVIEGQVKGEVSSLSAEELEKQAGYAKRSLVHVSPNTRGTCIDERRRIGTRGQEGEVEPRPSAPGGPDVYALYVAELSGYFGDTESDVNARLSAVKNDINSKGIPSGGHDHCAANASFRDIVALIYDKPEYVKGYAQKNMGDGFDNKFADEVISYAKSVSESGRYDDHTESTLSDVFGEEAHNGIEELLGEHKGRTVIRNKVKSHTVDQTKLSHLTEHETGAAEDSFVMDDWYADNIENALAAGPDLVHAKKLMEHAREFVLAAVAASVPNQELHQIALTA